MFLLIFPGVNEGLCQISYSCLLCLSCDQNQMTSPAEVWNQMNHRGYSLTSETNISASWGPWTGDNLSASFLIVFLNCLYLERLLWSAFDQSISFLYVQGSLLGKEMRANRQTPWKVAKDSWNVILSRRWSDSNGPSVQKSSHSQSIFKLQFPFLSCDTVNKNNFLLWRRKALFYTLTLCWKRKSWNELEWIRVPQSTPHRPEPSDRQTIWECSG